MMNFQLPQIREDDLTNRQEIRRILEALYQLSEQLRYFSYTIGEENLSDELKDTLTRQQTQLSQLNREVRNSITGALSQIRQQSGEIALKVSRTDYAQALENLNALIRENASSITQNASAIESTVSKSTYDDAMDNLTSQISSIIQTANEITMNFNTISSTVNNNGEALTEINKYIRFEDGDIILGQEGNNLILHIENDRIAYEYKNIAATYFADEKLVISYNGSAQRIEQGVNGEDPYLTIYDEDGVMQLNLTKAGIEFGGGSMLTPFTVGTLSGMAVFL